MTPTHTITHMIFLIFAGTAVLATISLLTRQSLLVAYIALGALLGPWGFKLINNNEVIKQTGDIGIIFLLFLLGLDLQPQNLLHSLRKMSLITASSSLIFFVLGFLPGIFFGYTYTECLVIGIASMFSSTIIGIKLLPTTTLHHQHTGELVISILLLQDIIAIAAILSIEVIADKSSLSHLTAVLSSLPILMLVAYAFQRHILGKLFSRFDQIHEYIFILSIGWCLCMAELSHMLGVSGEIGAFIAGVALASNPISSYIVESLKPLRDFFLIIFFFSIGAGFDFGYLPQVVIPASILAITMIIAKPIAFSKLLRKSGEVAVMSREIGVRLGQMSEFSLLLIYMAVETHLISPLTSSMAQAAIILTFIISCYWIVMYYPNPLASTPKLRRD